MSPPVFPSSLLHLIAIGLVLITMAAKCCCAEYESFAEYEGAFKECSRLFNCGNIQGIGYPFWREGRPQICGREGFMLTCRDNQYPVMNISGQAFHVLNVSKADFTMTIARVDLWNDICPRVFFNTTLTDGLLSKYSSVQNLKIFYGCASSMTKQVEDYFTCLTNGSRTAGFYANAIVPEVKECNITIQVPIGVVAYRGLWYGNLTLQEALNQGFDVEYYKDSASCSACVASGGICGSDIHYVTMDFGASSDRFLCYCPDGLLDYPHQWEARKSSF